MNKYPLLTGALCTLLTALPLSCDPFDPEQMRQEEQRSQNTSGVSVETVARLLSSLPLEAGQLAEVHAAATASSANGYDEEYRMLDLFTAPGAGVGDSASGTRASYARPLRDLLRDAASEAWLDSLAGSDVQIYWPFSDAWDGEQAPVLTYDPGDGSERNEGWCLRPDGTLQKLLVDEQMALERPVWVINHNSDAAFPTLEMLRREDPDWGAGGDLVVGGGKAGSSDGLRTLVLRSFKAKRQYDSWFSGASEFFVKVGAVENFRASTEAELRLYEPSITDFMLVVRRKQVGEELPFNAVLVSDWTSQLDNIALMIVEDDGGTRTSWKCGATLKYSSKSYGLEIEIPLNSRDDVVWRGALTRRYVERYSGSVGSFGDVDLVLELL